LSYSIGPFGRSRPINRNQSGLNKKNIISRACLKFECLAEAVERTGMSWLLLVSLSSTKNLLLQGALMKTFMTDVQQWYISAIPLFESIPPVGYLSKVGQWR
jgi:hypothetical protein